MSISSSKGKHTIGKGTKMLKTKHIHIMAYVVYNANFLKLLLNVNNQIFVHLEFFIRYIVVIAD